MTHPDADFTAQTAALVAANDRVPEQRAGGRKLTDSQFDCLWALSLGSKGSGSNARTLESLRRKGLATWRQHQGEPLWEATWAWEALLNNDERSAP